MKRKLTFIESISCFIVLSALFGIGFGIYEIAIQPLLLITSLYSVLIGLRVGVSWEEMEDNIIKNLKTAIPAIFIFFVVSIIIGTWIYSGTVPMFIYYGLKLIHPSYFLVMAFIIVAIV